jgi:predicted NUDIX family NTP pyrophosphohydrolase
MSLDTFEQSLLTELRLHVAARTAARATPRRRWTVGIAGGGLTAAAAAVAISLGIGVSGPSAAYGIESQHDGDVVVTVYDLSDANGLERALAAKGVQAEITYVQGFSQADGQTRSKSGVDRAGCAIAVAKVNGGLRFTLTSVLIASGAKLDIVTSGSSPTDVGSPVAVTWSGGLC